MTSLPSEPLHDLLGLYDSPFVRRVAIALWHYEIPYSHRALSVFRNVPQMEESNPLLRVPMLTTPPGERLHESSLILDYLDELAASQGRLPLTPRSGADRRRVLQIQGIAQAAMEKAVAIVYEFRRPEALRWPEWLERLRGQLWAALVLLEKALAGEWMALGRLTQADVSAVVAVSFIRHTIPGEWPKESFPRLEALTARLEARPEFRAVPLES